MKRKLLSLAALCLALLLLAACGGSGGTKPLPSAEDLSKTLADSGVFSDELEMVDADIAAYLYGLTDTEGTAVYSWLSSSGGTAEEFSLFLCKDASAAQALRQSAEARVENQKRLYADYAPAEVPKLEGAVVRVRDSALVVCVAADAEKASKLLSAYFPA